MFSKIMDHKYELFGAAAIFTGLAGYLLYKRSKNQQSEQSKVSKK